uniref:Uncharacterized protein n=1 Tax=Timema shepardi TaxID=629360 RepID=A0A7R9B6H5_TIMSH|nr:unnamed protein product [Timema shepardi]
MDVGYPHNITRWRGVPSNLDAAMTWADETNPIGQWKESKEWSGFDSVNYGVHAPRLKKTLVL